MDLETYNSLKKIDNAKLQGALVYSEDMSYPYLIVNTYDEKIQGLVLSSTRKAMIGAFNSNSDPVLLIADRLCPLTEPYDNLADFIKEEIIMFTDVTEDDLAEVHLTLQDTAETKIEALIHHDREQVLENGHFHLRRLDQANDDEDYF